MNEREYAYWLCHMDFLGAVSIKKLYERFGSFQEIYNIEGKILSREGLLKADKAQRFDALKRELESCKKQLERLQNNGIRFVTWLDKEFPGRLLRIPGCPAWLTVSGKFPDEEHPAAAIIGARDCSNYGIQMAEYIGRELAGAGVEIVSGLAHGIDAAGHRGALAAGGNTYGVLGCGIDICYPRENYSLYGQIAQQGGLITEFMPGEQPKPRNFPMRNRIISGLADVILVIQARKKSGSLITAGLALDQGKDVFALPGRVDDALSEGCNQLIRDGAGILLTPSDVLEYFSLEAGKILRVHEKNENRLAKKAKMVYSCLDLQPKSLEEIVRESGLSVSECMVLLLNLELEGYIVETSHQYYGKKH